MLGRRLHDRPAWSAAGLAAELAAARGRADLAGAEDGPVAAAFSLAYRGLSAGQQRMFARLGLYPGTEIDAWAGAALLGCDRAAAEQGLAGLRDRAGDHAAAAAELTRALRLYREAGRRDGEAAALAELGTARYLAGDARGAAADLEQSLRLYLALGSRAGEAAALNELGHLLGWSGDRPSATRALARSAQLCRDLGDRHGEASAHGRLGALRVLAGDFADATTALAAARRLYRELGHRGGEAGAITGLAVVQRMTGRRGEEAAVLNRLGTLRRQSGAPGEALACHRRALDLAREVRSPLEEARALEGAGRCALGTGRTAVAAVGFRQALRIYQRIGADEAAGLAAELDRLSGATVSR
ncbi:MAG TPA: tetratricopeptide repeat protein [Streptosporangiaceae bacterium]